MTSAANFHFDNSFARELEGCYVPWRPDPVPTPRLLFLNHALATELGLDSTALDDDAWAATFAGNTLPDGAEPLAQAYAGHQFGGFSPQLGDGRALLVGELIDAGDVGATSPSRVRPHAVRPQRRRQGRRRPDAARGADRRGHARAGHPHHAGVGVVATGEPVHRERTLPGAVLTRVAASHIRVGTFEFFAARGDVQRLRKLAEYSIARHDPELAAAPSPSWRCCASVAERQAALVAGG